MTRFFTAAGGSLGLLTTNVALICAAIPGQAQASPWGCQVALCLATPGSPTTYAACVEPITKLWRVLATGGHFPDCAEAGIALSKFGDGPIVMETSADGTKRYYWLARDSAGDITFDTYSQEAVGLIARARAKTADGR